MRLTRRCPATPRASLARWTTGPAASASVCARRPPSATAARARANSVDGGLRAVGRDRASPCARALRRRRARSACAAPASASSSARGVVRAAGRRTRPARPAPRRAPPAAATHSVASRAQLRAAGRRAARRHARCRDRRSRSRPPRRQRGRRRPRSGRRATPVVRRPRQPAGSRRRRRRAGPRRGRRPTGSPPRASSSSAAAADSRGSGRRARALARGLACAAVARGRPAGRSRSRGRPSPRRGRSGPSPRPARRPVRPAPRRARPAARPGSRSPRPFGRSPRSQIELGQRRGCGVGALVLGSAAPVERRRRPGRGDGVGAVGGRSRVLGAAADRARRRRRPVPPASSAAMLASRASTRRRCSSAALSVTRCRRVAPRPRGLARLVGGELGAAARLGPARPAARSRPRRRGLSAQLRSRVTRPRGLPRSSAGSAAAPDGQHVGHRLGAADLARAARDRVPAVRRRPLLDARPDGSAQRPLRRLRSARARASRHRQAIAGSSAPAGRVAASAAATRGRGVVAGGEQRPDRLGALGGREQPAPPARRPRSAPRARALRRARSA